MELDVTHIADDELIRDIFSFTLWGVEEGIDYIVGIYKTSNIEGGFELVTLDGETYREPEHELQVQEFFARHDRVRRIWDHSKKKGERYYPSTFIKWALEHRNACRLSWLSDAQNKGLVPLNFDKVEEASDADLNRELRESERTALLKIIAGVTANAYLKDGSTYQGIYKNIMEVLEKKGVGIADNTLRNHLKAAWELLPKTSKPQ